MAHTHTGTPPSHTERTVGGTTVLALHGEIDILTEPALRARFDALTAAPGPDLVVDLRPVSFIDCAGLRVLCRARNRAEARHGRLRLVTDSAGFRRLLRLTGLADAFELYPRLADALDRAGTATGGTPAGRRPA
ncbi:STAS domain-containing protein [Streptomyces sp. NPDC052701]|uniref:STAS domain-containing protein n=1 Tax=Streptomyces sp. NPDC052701 TaxID=3155533 RepID=UPI00343EC324